MEAVRILQPALSPPAWPADRPLRAWQESALEQVLAHPAGDFLASELRS